VALGRQVVAPNNRKEEITLMKTFGLATVLALLLAAPAVAATDENIGISMETLLNLGGSGTFDDEL
jgi:hypothetical protein